MRLAPIPMFFFSNLEAAEQYAGESSRTTHGAMECVDACRLFSRIIWRALHGMTKEDVVLGDSNSFTGAEKIVSIARGAYIEKTDSNIRGTGYVVNSLEAALWCFTRPNSFEEAILMAANLGDDADTTAAVCGQIAGAFYGASGIPPGWLRRLALCADIRQLADEPFKRHGETGQVSLRA
jgi:ADP-ribosyl-[dinitrogen reductase] hydrolase